MTGTISIYPKKGRALVYRHPDRYEFSFFGTGPAPDFIYKLVPAPLSSHSAEFGQLAVQCIMGYRRISEEEFAEQGRLPNVCLWPEENATEVSAQFDLKEVDRFMIPLDASPEQIGKAILKAFESIDAQIAKGAAPSARTKPVRIQRKPPSA